MMNRILTHRIRRSVIIHFNNEGIGYQPNLTFAMVVWLGLKELNALPMYSVNLIREKVDIL